MPSANATAASPTSCPGLRSLTSRSVFELGLLQQRVLDRARVLEIEAARHGEHMLRISVRDSGVGLDPEERDKIFQAFYTTKPDGLGMGLAISRSIVEAHGGRLWVTPNSGPGATFHLTLPLGTPAAA